MPIGVVTSDAKCCSSSITIFFISSQVAGVRHLLPLPPPPPPLISSQQNNLQRGTAKRSERERDKDNNSIALTESRLHGNRVAQATCRFEFFAISLAGCLTDNYGSYFPSRELAREPASKGEKLIWPTLAVARIED